MRATPHAVLVPCALGVAYDGQCGQAWCVKWCPHGMHEKIATGFSDGEDVSPFTPEICNAFEALFKHAGQASASRVYFKFNVSNRRFLWTGHLLYIVSLTQVYGWVTEK